MKHIYILLIILCYVKLLTAQNAPAIEWQKCLGGIADDYGESIQKTIDGGFIVGG